ncbi:hypothetical protein [Streptomyces sp. NBC_00310]|uniref:hypothetical protein n=1 Tax=Streptomyces sp. NBC_00310 TaxID=2903645 RepID=UPI002E23F1FE
MLGEVHIAAPVFARFALGAAATAAGGGGDGHIPQYWLGLQVRVLVEECGHLGRVDLGREKSRGRPQGLVRPLGLGISLAKRRGFHSLIGGQPVVTLTAIGPVLQLCLSICPGQRACFESSELTLHQDGDGS